MVRSWGGNMQGWQLMGLTVSAFWVSDELHSLSGWSTGMHLFNCGFPEPSLMWVPPGREVPCGISNIPGMISREPHELSKCCQWRCGSNIIDFWFQDCGNTQFSCAVLLVSFMEVVGLISQSRLCHVVNFHLLLAKPLYMLLDHFGGCAHHPAGFIIFARLAPQHCNFIILIFAILHIVRTSKMAQTVFDSNLHPWNVPLGSEVVNPTFSAFLLLSWCCLINVSASSTRFLATVVCLAT